MTMENIERVIVTKSQVSGDGPRFLTDSDTKRVTIAGFLELYKNQGSLVIGNDEIVYFLSFHTTFQSYICNHNHCCHHPHHFEPFDPDDKIPSVLDDQVPYNILMTQFHQCFVGMIMIILTNILVFS